MPVATPVIRAHLSPALSSDSGLSAQGAYGRP